MQHLKFSNKNNQLPAWRNFKINFSRPVFTIIFRPKMVFLDTGYILRVKTIVEFLIKCVLIFLFNFHVWQISSPFAPLSIFDDITCKEKYKRSNKVHS